MMFRHNAAALPSILNPVAMLPARLCADQNACRN